MKTEEVENLKETTSCGCYCLASIIPNDTYQEHSIDPDHVCELTRNAAILRHNTPSFPHVAERRLYLPIREWVEEFMSRRALDNDELESVKDRAKKWISLMEEGDLFIPIIGKSIPWTDSTVEVIRRNVLIDSGLPATPGTAAFILNECKKDHPEVMALKSGISDKEIIPTRGAIVTSRQMMPLSAQPDISRSKVAVFQTSSIEFMQMDNDTVRRRASKVKIRHANYLAAIISKQYSQVNSQKGGRPVDNKNVNEWADDYALVISLFNKGTLPADKKEFLLTALRTEIENAVVNAKANPDIQESTTSVDAIVNQKIKDAKKRKNIQ